MDSSHATPYHAFPQGFEGCALPYLPSRDVPGRTTAHPAVPCLPCLVLPRHSTPAAPSLPSLSGPGEDEPSHACHTPTHQAETGGALPRLPSQALRCRAPPNRACRTTPVLTKPRLLEPDHATTHRACHAEPYPDPPTHARPCLPHRTQTHPEMPDRTSPWLPSPTMPCLTKPDHTTPAKPYHSLPHRA